jgi:hypothetical protein
MINVILLQLAAGTELKGKPCPHSGDYYDFQWVITDDRVNPVFGLTRYLSYYQYPAMKNILDDVLTMEDKQEFRQFWNEALSASRGSSHGKLFTAEELSKEGVIIELHFNYWARWQKLHLVT